MVKQYQVLISNEAQISLQLIVDYLTKEKSLQTALKIEQRLLEAIQSLKTFPEGYGTLDIERKGGGSPYRFLPKENYKIIYTVEEEPDELVIIIELIHDSRSMSRIEKILP